MHALVQVFNMGSRLEVIVKPEHAPAVIEVSRSFGVEARVVGRVETRPADATHRLIIQSKHGRFEYA